MGVVKPKRLNSITENCIMLMSLGASKPKCLNIIAKIKYWYLYLKVFSKYDCSSWLMWLLFKLRFIPFRYNQGPSWLWSYGSWIYTELPVQSVHITTDVVSSNLDQGEVYNIMWSSLSVTCDKSVVFSGSSCFVHQ
jgi:hypothetical protein